MGTFGNSLTPHFTQCISFLLLCDKLPKTQWLKIAHIDCLRDSLGLEFRRGLTGPLLRVTRGCNQRVSQDCFLTRGFAGKESSEFTQVVGRIHFLMVVGLLAPHFSKTAAERESSENRCCALVWSCVCKQSFTSVTFAISRGCKQATGPTQTQEKDRSVSTGRQDQGSLPARPGLSSHLGKSECVK